MKIGLLGGSFDPPHRGHVALARLAMERLRLDRVLFAPVGLQPLKRDRPQAGFADRAAMTQLAIAGEAGMEISLIDAPHPDGQPNYTIDTLRALRGQSPAGSRIYCLMGADSFLSIGRWHRATELLVTCDFVVAARPGFASQAAEGDPVLDVGRLIAALPVGITAAACEIPEPGEALLCLRNRAGRESHLHLLPDLAEEVSASAIRAAFGQGGDPDAVVAPGVAAYIREHGLYHRGAGS
ncbi:MAG TPA: nicotinate (nicotinamide) nucleotide adenylyltransferase [Acidobacteriaceae bacterium]|jgi:nicotinate-nucleotide adenylyltransferase|nr:nicotinate (nicotinamide) nucleotide adenylyltransferase [Acidobacteriaceae bacterium]